MVTKVKKNVLTITRLLGIDADVDTGAQLYCHRNLLQEVRCQKDRGKPATYVLRVIKK